MEGMEPTLKLISKRDFDTVKSKYGFINQDVEKEATKIIEIAEPLDVLALSVRPGSGLKILDVKLINEGKFDVFLQILREGAVQL